MPATKKKIKICDACEESDNTPIKYSDIFDINLCKSCNESPDYKLIYKTTSKKKYFITEKEILELQLFASQSSYGAAKLVLEQDVKDLFCMKHQITPDQIDDKLEVLEKKKSDRIEKIDKNREIKRSKRKKELKSALREIGLELRADSKLCQGYIDGTITNWDVDGIVERMAQMKYLYEYANMEHYLKKAERAQAEELEAGYIPDIPVFTQAEDYALKKTGGKYPKKWPWL
jgi:hypothetical protein